jgi:hypothetical protein
MVIYFAILVCLSAVKNECSSLMRIDGNSIYATLDECHADIANRGHSEHERWICVNPLRAAE